MASVIHLKHLWDLVTHIIKNSKAIMHFIERLHASGVVCIMALAAFLKTFLSPIQYEISSDIVIRQQGIKLFCAIASNFKSSVTQYEDH